MNGAEPRCNQQQAINDPGCQPMSERECLESEYGRVWDTVQLAQDFDIKAFVAPYVVAVQKSTGKIGTLQYQQDPRFYFSWTEDTSDDKG